MLIQGHSVLPFKNKDYLFIPEIKKAVEEKADTIKAYVVGEAEMKEFTLKLYVCRGESCLAIL